MRQKAKRTVSCLVCIILIFSLSASRMKNMVICASGDSREVAFLVTEQVTVNGSNITEKVQSREELPNWKDGILYTLQNAEVEKESSSEGSAFVSNNDIYSAAGYQMKATKNCYSGTLVAEKDIEVSGQSTQLKRGILYSKNGDIKLAGDSLNFTGILYAPNGTVEISSKDFRLKGCIISQSVVMNVNDWRVEPDEAYFRQIDRFSEYRQSHYADMVLSYQDEEQKIALEELNAQQITMYYRYDQKDFQSAGKCQEGDLFDPPEKGTYFEAYAEIIDEFGEERITNIRTFQGESEGLCSEIRRDENGNGILDGYETKQYQDSMKRVKSEDFDADIRLDRDVWDQIKTFASDALCQVEQKEDQVLCHYEVQPYDNVEIFYNDEGQKVVQVFNSNDQMQKMEWIDQAYTLLFLNENREVHAKVAFDGKNQIYNEYTYGKKGVKKIKHNGMSYDFRYDSKGRVKDFAINQSDILCSEWETEKRCKKTMANGAVFLLEYDAVDNLTRLSDEQGVLYEWTYDPDQYYQLTEVKDHVNQEQYTYHYDEEGELCAEEHSDGYAYVLEQDGLNETRTMQYRGKTQQEEYKISETQSVYSNGAIISVENEEETTFSYAGKQIQSRKTSLDSLGNTIVTTNQGTKKYVYNARDLLREVWVDGTLVCSYEYNNINELLRENSAEADKTWVYQYDEGGNLVEVRSYPLDFKTPTEDLGAGTVESRYSYDSSFTDQLVQYQGKKITYDRMGNPLQYWDGKQFAWTQGQRLKRISIDEETVSYSYDMEGKRVKKIRNGEEITYLYQGDQLVGEFSEQEDIWYHYDAMGKLVFMEKGEEVYFYQLDAQNNVTGLLDRTGKEIVQYQYDGWGRLSGISGDQKVGKANPFRYRSYYYDEESGFYYLQNRYYDPEVKRMINMDSYTDTGFGMFSHNLYAYCENTPVNTSNCSGNVPTWVTKLSKKTSQNYYWKQSSNDQGINCLGYATDVNRWFRPGNYAGYNYGWTVESIRAAVIADLKKLGRSTCRAVSREEARGLSKDWNLVAFKIGTSKNSDWRFYHDAHFMRRRYKDGIFWAHKPNVSSILIHKKGAFASGNWNGDMYVGGWADSGYTYTSSTGFFAYRFK